MAKKTCDSNKSTELNENFEPDFIQCSDFCYEFVCNYCTFIEGLRSRWGFFFFFFFWSSILSAWSTLFFLLCYLLLFNNLSKWIFFFFLFFLRLYWQNRFFTNFQVINTGEKTDPEIDHQKKKIPSLAPWGVCTHLHIENKKTSIKDCDTNSGNQQSWVTACINQFHRLERCYISSCMKNKRERSSSDVMLYHCV